MCLSRRSVLTGAAALSAAGICGVQAKAAGPMGGCFISPADFNAIRSSQAFNGSAAKLFDRDKHLRTTGDKAMDKALDATIKKLSDLFGQVPAFGFYRESDYPGVGAENAFATTENTAIPGTWGTVAFGTTLFEREMNKFDATGSTIVAVIAHEFAHIWAFRRGVMDDLNAGQPTVKRSELHADYLAGFFLGMRKRANSAIKLQAAGDLFHRLGDNNFNSSNHHGTSTERVAAAERGFRTGYVDGKTADYAFSEASEYVSTL